MPTQTKKSSRCTPVISSLQGQSLCTCERTPFRIGHHRFTLILVCGRHTMGPKSRFSGENPPVFGSVWYMTLEMAICGAMPVTRRCETVLHELGHVAAWYAGFPPKGKPGTRGYARSNSEAMANAFAAVMNAYLELLPFLTSAPVLRGI